MAIRQKVIYWGLSFLLGVFTASSGWSFYITALIFSAGIIIFKILILGGRSQKYPHIPTDTEQPVVSIVEPSRKKSVGVFLVMGVAFLTFGFFYYHFFQNFTNRRENIPVGTKISFSGTISKDPEEKETYQKLIVDFQAPWRGKIIVLTEPLLNFDYGDEIKIEGKIEESEFKNQPPIVFFPKIEAQAKNRGGWLRARLYRLKNHLTGQFKNHLSPDKAALISGITFGERSEFSQELKNDMSRSGVTHIVALSGYNIAILALAIERSLKKIISRRKRFYLTLGIIFLFVLMVGGEASVVRAAIMGSLILLAQHIGRPHDTLHIIVLTALGMVLFNPAILVFDIGFQLSFLSLLGIVYLEPVLKKLFRMKDEKKESFLAWRENGLTTTAAQLAVIPILVLNFNQFSLTAVLANALILVTVPFTMFLGFLLATLSSVSLSLGFFVAQIASLLTSYQIAVIKIFSVIYLPIPGSQFLNSSIIIIIYYGVLSVLAFKNYEKS